MRYESGPYLGSVDMLGFERWARGHGAVVMDPTSEWEALRVRGKGGVFVVYFDKHGLTKWPARVIRTYDWYCKTIDASDVESYFFVGGCMPKSGRRRGRLRTFLYMRDGGRCWLCGSRMTGADVTFEHLDPMANGGDNRLRNVTLCHEECNRLLGSRSIEDKYRLRYFSRRGVSSPERHL